MTSLIGYLAVPSYLLAFIFIAFRVNKQSNNTIFPSRKAVVATWALALFLHFIALYKPFVLEESLYLDFFSAGSHIAWLTSLILFITTCTRKIDILGLFLLPITSLLLLISLLSSPVEATQINGTLALHVLLSLLAYSTLFLATIQAAVLLIQKKHLHNHQSNRLIRSLPALQDMEKLLFHMILIGVILLTASLVSGFIVFDDLFAKKNIHKTVLSIIAWLVYSTLLIGHWKNGWRGRKASHWTFIAFVFLILAFFGSKFVRQFLLNN